MVDLSPGLAARLGRLLPRLGSDAPAEITAAAAAIRRALARAGLDLHDLAARLAESQRPAVRDMPSLGLRSKAEALRTVASGRLTPREAEFVHRACRLLASGASLSERQAHWLRDLHAQVFRPGDGE